MRNILTDCCLRTVILSALAMLAFGGSLSAHNADVEELLCRLDSVIETPAIWDGMKLHRIAELRKKEKQVRTLEDRYWYNKNLYDEYSVFNADSAMAYANRNYDIALQLGDDAKQMEWEINRSFILSVTGLLKEAQDAIDRVDVDRLPDELLSAYYNQMAYLFSHYGQYQGESHTSPTDYYVQSSLYQDSTFKYAIPTEPLYLWYKAWTKIGSTETERNKLIEELKADVDSSHMDSRADAMKAYVLARFYEKGGDTENRVKYLTLSAICDVMTANKDIASLEELGKIMIEEGDIDRAYAYVNHCQQQAQSFNNRIRAYSLAKAEKHIRDLYSDRNSAQQSRLQVFLWVLLCLTAVLAIAVVIIIRKNKRLYESQEHLSNLNAEIKKHLTELSEMRETEKRTTLRLKEMNGELKEVNEQLKEANIMREEYVGHMFTMCSNYINKLDTFRKMVLRKLKANQFDDLMAMVDTNTMSQTELKEFYQNFDSIFLNMFPDFVKDFNELLRPEERITVKDNMSLNTELRIYALVRLGITDSVKIAALLHYSTQTVYNNRLRTRNKAIIPKEKFAETVRSLGKFHIEQ